MPQIYYLPDEMKVDIEPEKSILDASLDAGIPHTNVCGGNARCSTCRVMILDGLEYCTPRTENELILAEHLNFCPSIRLACQTKITGDVNLRRLVLDDADVELTSQLKRNLHTSSVGEEKEVAILFADIRGFTNFAEALVPYDVVHVLNRYFLRMDQAIMRNGGYIDNYMGDGLLALFGVENNDNASLHAVKAGLEMLEEMERLRPYLQTIYDRCWEIGIGIHYGEAVIGTIGGSIRRTTIIGDSVNFASRIESANKELKTNLLVSERVYEMVKAKVLVNQRVKLKIKGKTGEYALYQIIGLDVNRSDE
ncbi:MAG TPA: adenylate/guanylate cyclase domain-containing protein [Thermodesulfobacteriota bacterium]|jgi:adenylate cyclase